MMLPQIRTLRRLVREGVAQFDETALRAANGDDEHCLLCGDDLTVLPPACVVEVGLLMRFCSVRCKDRWIKACREIAGLQENDTDGTHN